MSKTVVVTGASGLLGRAVAAEFAAKGDKVIKLAWTRADKDKSYTKLDLTDEAAAEAFFSQNKVDVVVHCAAERRPDVAEANPELVKQINVDVPLRLASMAKKHDFELLFISTDYVFDGKNPPYEVDAPTSPLQSYGQSKVDAEQAILSVRSQGSRSTILRIPLLYGKTEYNAESAVNIIRDVVEDQSGKTYKMDHVQSRFPTNVEDVARVLHDLARQLHTGPSSEQKLTVDLDKELPAIVHYCSPAPAVTKYDITVIIADALGLPHTHVIKETTVPAGATSRPENSQLSTKSLKELGVDTSEKVPFADWWKAYVKQ